MFAASKTAGASGVPTDPYFYDVSLLLNGDSINGTSTFISDASTNNFQITPNGLPGNSVQNPYQAGYYSNNITTGNYLNAPANTAFEMGIGDFTIEAWIYPTTTAGSSGTEIISYGASGSFDGWHFYQLPSTNYLGFGLNYAGVIVSSSTSLALNQWSHVAVTRSGTSFKLWINGVNDGTGISILAQLTSGSDLVYVGTGSYSQGADRSFNGFISNARVIKGTAIYTTTFTPSTTPLTAISGTSLLTCQSNRFIDNSTNAFTLTPNGTPTVSQNQPFTYTTPVTNGSGYFNASASYLTAPSSAAFTLGTNPTFTLEGWIYLNGAQGAYTCIASTYTDFNTGFVNRWLLGVSSTTVRWWDSAGNFGASSSALNTNQWIHVAVVGNGSSIILYINGVSVATQSVNFSYTTQASLKIGGGVPSMSDFNGYISNLRLVNGTAVYTSNFTPPSAPLTAVTNTSILTLQPNVPAQNSTFVDSSANQFLITRNGNTTQGSFSPYGNLWSNYFNGSSNLLTPSSASISNFSGDFTIEGWVYLNSATSYAVLIGGDGSNGWYVEYSSNRGFGAYDGSSFKSGSSSAIVGQWVHYAITRASGTLRFFINGSVTATTTSSNFNYTQALGISAYSGGSSFINGYQSNVRINNTTALYTGTFTSSTTPLTAVSGTTLLTCQSNRFIDNSSNNFAITVNGSPSVQRFSPFNPTAPYSTSVIGGSGYFDGSGDYLTVPNNAALQLGSSDFTIGAWVYVTATSGSAQTLIAKGTGSGNQASYVIQLNSSGTWVYNISNNGATWSYADVPIGTNTLNTWQYIALVRSGSTFTPYLNGVAGTVTTSSLTLFAGTAVLSLGSDDTGGNRLTGYISDARVVKGTAIVPSTNPTTPSTAVTNTQLLTNFTNAGIPDLAMQNNLETVGSAQVSTTVKKYGTGSLYFNGSSNLLSPATGALGFGTGDFTIEHWLYFPSSPATGQLLRSGDSGNTGGIAWQYNAGNLELYSQNTALEIQVPFSPSATTWYHIALTRSGTTLKVFVNGTQAGLSATSSRNFVDGAIYVAFGGAGYLNGYLDDLRITKGYARYTSNFTPPTAALPTY
jgi:hypothetical protein